MLVEEDRAWAKLAGVALVPQPRIDVGPLLAALPGREGAERTLLAEAYVASSTATARGADRALRAQALSKLGVRRDGAMRALVLEPGAARRDAIVRAVVSAETDARDAAIAAVDSIRTAFDAIRGVLPELGAGAAALDVVGARTVATRSLAEAVLRETQDAWTELMRGRAKVTLGRGKGGLDDHAALLRAATADRVLPLADRNGIASRWTGRIDLLPAEVSGGIPTPSSDGPPPRVVQLGGRERPRIVFAPAPDTHGLLELLGIVGELVAFVPRTGEPSLLAHRLGVTRIRVPTAHTLARRLLLEPTFLMREAAVDRSAVAACLRELSFVELTRLRTAAMHALALVFALDREPGLGERIAEVHARALSVPLQPALAPHRVVEAFDLGAPALLEALVVEPGIAAHLRETYDEDWFRNPRAGAAVQAALARAGAPLADDLEPDAAIAKRVAGLERSVRRWFDSADA